VRSALRGLPKHLLDDIEEDYVIEYLALALTWLVVSTAFSVLVGKGIAVGLAGGTVRPGRGAAAPDAAALPVLGKALVVPPQRRPSVPAELVGQHLPGALRL
jgi:hypothetical protein